MKISDQALMLAFQQGETAKLAELFERYYRQLYRFCFGICRLQGVSEDCVQEVFQKLLHKKASYAGTGSFKVWIHQVTRNCLVDMLRKENKYLAFDNTEQFADSAGDSATLSATTQVMVNEAGGVSDLLEGLEWQQKIALLKQALDKLSFEQREVIILSRFHGMKYEQISQITGASLSAIKLRFKRALGLLTHHCQQLEKLSVREQQVRS